MKKVIAFLSSLLVFAGLKAQITPAIKKETVNPGQLTRPLPADSLKTVKGLNKITSPGNADSLKALKIGTQIMKETKALPTKENVLPAKPVKG